MKTTRAAAGFGALVLFAGLSGFTFATGDAPCDPNAPGSCDKYNPNDPYVGGGKPAGPAPAKTIQMLPGDIFNPTEITVSPGEMWTEDNKGEAKHNIEIYEFTGPKDSKPTELQHGQGNLGPDVMPGKSAQFAMPKKPGLYMTYCYYHENTMQLTIHVK
jgi:plastocyanin